MSARSLLLGLLATVASFGNVVAVEPQVGGCQRDVCSWRKQLSRDLVGSSAAGALFRVTFLGGSAPDSGRKPSIKWNRKPHDVYVFCSKQLPAVMMQVDGSLQVDALGISPDEYPPPVLYTSASIYMEVCHNTPDQDLNVLAKRFGYAVSSQDAEAMSQGIKVPEDVLKVH
jgi:hypothetical protein